MTAAEIVLRVRRSVEEGMSIFGKRKDELKELTQRIASLEATERAQNVRINKLEQLRELDAKRIAELEEHMRNILAPRVQA